MKYRIREPGTTISGFADSLKKKKLMPTDPRFFCHVTVNTHIFFFGLTGFHDIAEILLKVALNTKKANPNPIHLIL